MNAETHRAADEHALFLAAHYILYTVFAIAGKGINCTVSSAVATIIVEFLWEGYSRRAQ